MAGSGFGKKGGVGPTSGRKAVSYKVTLPDGTSVTKRTFFPPNNPCGFAYEANGQWILAAVNETDASHLQHYTKCPAEMV